MSASSYFAVIAGRYRLPQGAVQREEESSRGEHLLAAPIAEGEPRVTGLTGFYNLEAEIRSSFTY